LHSITLKRIDVNVNENHQPNMQKKYICLVSFLHIHTKYLDLQACKKLAHGGVKTFDDYMCISVNVKICIYI